MATEDQSKIQSKNEPSNPRRRLPLRSRRRSGRARSGSGSDSEAVDVVVVGSGPNGLAAAITAARAGRSVLVLEAEDEPGGATRSAPLVGPGYVNDLGSAVHPLASASPFMQTIDWESKGVEWVVPPAAAGHPLDGGRSAMAWNDINRTAADLGRDGKTWRSTFGPLVRRFDELASFALGVPLTQAWSHPLAALRIGSQFAVPANLLARRFDTDEAKALFAGMAAHAVLPLNRPFTAGFGLMFTSSAHAVGWPFPRGGAAEIARAMVDTLTDLGGEVRTGHRVATMDDLPPAGAVVFALTPRQIVDIMGDALPTLNRRRFRRFPYGPGGCKLDLALSEPIPWGDPSLAMAGTVHLGGTFDEIAEAEATVAAGRHADRPYVLLAQHTLFDPTRAPADRHTVWAYSHVPNGSNVDVSGNIEAQIERFAPGFRDLIIGRHASRAVDLERWNANLIGGDIGGGSYGGLRTMFRPGLVIDPHRLAVDGHFIGSASTSPGAGVHGMSGHLAGLQAVAYLEGRRSD